MTYRTKSYVFYLRNLNNNINITEDGFVLTKNRDMWKEDANGNVLQSFMFSGIEHIYYPVPGKGYDEVICYELSDYAMYQVSGCYGIMNRITGKPITSAKFADVDMISKGLFKVQDSESLEWYIIDTNGRQI